MPGPAGVVLDAGISTEENLRLIEEKGYKYLCVSRAKLKDYTYEKTVTTRKCTVPDEKLKRIYDILQTKHQPFTKRKSVVHKLESKKTKPLNNNYF